MRRRQLRSPQQCTCGNCCRLASSSVKLEAAYAFCSISCHGLAPDVAGLRGSEALRPSDVVMLSLGAIVTVMIGCSMHSHCHQEAHRRSCKLVDSRNHQVQRLHCDPDTCMLAAALTIVPRCKDMSVLLIFANSCVCAGGSFSRRDCQISEG